MEEVTQVTNEVQNNSDSYFDGGVFQLLGWKVLGGLVTVITLGICYPLAVNWLYSWEAKHTVIEGRRLKFTGSAGGLFGTWIICILLSIVTLGIYAFYVPIKIKRWREANTFFEDEIPSFDAEQNLRKEKASYFDGGFWQLFGWELLGVLITFFTAGICYPWAIKMIYSWEQRHKVYCKRRCTFDGNAMQLFGTWLLCMLLSIITLGIYTWWIPIKIKKWQIKHTHLLENDTPAEEDKYEGLTPEEIENRKKEKREKVFFYLYAAGLLLLVITGIFMIRGYGIGAYFNELFTSPFFIFTSAKWANWAFIDYLMYFLKMIGIILLLISFVLTIVKKQRIKYLDITGFILVGLFLYAKPFVQTFFSKNNELSSHRFCLQSVCYQTCFVNFIRSFVAQPLMNPFTIEELYKFPETFSQFLCA